MTSPFLPIHLEDLPANHKKQKARNFLESALPEHLEDFYRNAILSLPKLSLETLEAITGPRKKNLPANLQSLYQTFLDELESSLKGTYGQNPRELHSILYRMGLPTDVGCG